ncbi:TylF/MycF/NovP-related O-methyltransferase [Agrobacterium tumefaciens]|uniref:TylF/MycF/NovP-related O-methyltransferase n=1 Tax=Agrobacterium tumefaciens TaxID=358 RepID=UPI002AFF0248|nr:TylF/MycF/NovP-related O-methyltransferase [Agrobacterium tumefaciens]MEA1840698.1 TylF/MycF/NovP-related O-methyltransferase [Agrobacterium tumefaciens]
MSFGSKFLKSLFQSSREGELEKSWPTDFYSTVPHRYSVNLHRYKKIEDQLDPKELSSGFTHNEEHHKRDMNRFFTFCLIYDQIKKENISGDIAELGVYKGKTSYILANFARALGRTAYLFDTFEGFDPKDIQGIDSSIPLQFSDTSLETVREFVGEDNVVYVKGYFPESATQIPDNLTFSVVHLDCDLYNPMMSALNYFYPRMVEGGFIIVHDYSSLHWDGAENAADEFFSDKPECLIPLADSGGSAIVRKARASSDKFNNWRIKRLHDLSVGAWVPPRLLKTYLKDGWADVEDWGVWGLGERHTMSLIIPFVPETAIRLIFDVDALLLGRQIEQTVAVLVDGTNVAEWKFTSKNKRGDRELIIPLHLLQRDQNDESPPTIFFEFRPEFFTSPHSLKPSSEDTRPLGLAIHKLKIEVE